MKKNRIAFTLVMAFFAFCCACVFVPAVRVAIIDYACKNVMHRTLNYTYWKQQLFALAAVSFCAVVCLWAVVATNAGSAVFCQAKEDLCAKSKLVLAHKKYILIVFALFVFGFAAIIRADFYYGPADDLYRALSGSRGWRNFYRYVSEFLSVFVHTSPHAYDIAPLPQIMALAVMSVAAVMAALFLSDGRLSVWTCVASVPFCLFPFFLQNLSYRYDAPYMALAVLFSVLPFMFTENAVSHSVFSVAGLFLMCLSYQGASGIYIVLTAFWVLKNFLSAKKSTGEIALFVLRSVACYALTLLFFFSVFNVPPEGGSYVDKSFSLASVVGNARKYLLRVNSGLGFTSLRFFSLLVSVLFVLCTVLRSARNKIASLCLSLFFVLFAAVFSYGSYLALAVPLFSPRALFASGVFVSLLAIYVASCFGDGVFASKRLFIALSKVCVFALAYCTTVFAFAYGNALAAQKEYTSFRTNMLLQELAKVIPAREKDVTLVFENGIGLAPVARNLAKDYPVAYELVDTCLDRWGASFILQQYDFVQLAERKGGRAKERGEDVPVLSDSAYQTIYGADSSYYVRFKDFRHEIHN